MEPVRDWGWPAATTSQQISTQPIQSHFITSPLQPQHQSQLQSHHQAQHQALQQHRHQAEQQQVREVWNHKQQHHLSDTANNDYGSVFRDPHFMLDEIVDLNNAQTGLNGLPHHTSHNHYAATPFNHQAQQETAYLNNINPIYSTSSKHANAGLPQQQIRPTANPLYSNYPSAVPSQVNTATNGDVWYGVVNGTTTTVCPPKPAHRTFSASASNLTVQTVHNNTSASIDVEKVSDNSVNFNQSSTLERPTKLKNQQPNGSKICNTVDTSPALDSGLQRTITNKSARQWWKACWLHTNGSLTYETIRRQQKLRNAQSKSLQQPKNSESEIHDNTQPQSSTDLNDSTPPDMNHYNSLLMGLDAIGNRNGFHMDLQPLSNKPEQNYSNTDHMSKQGDRWKQTYGQSSFNKQVILPPPSGPLLKPCCDYCGDPILDDECTEAEGKVFHLNHFCCRECGRALGGLHYIMSEGKSSETDGDNSAASSDLKPKSGDGSHAYCLTCYDILFGELCEECGELIGCDVGSISHEKRCWHAWPQCFRCNTCSFSLLGHPFLPANDGKIYCSIDCSRAAKELRTKRARESLRKRQLKEHEMIQKNQNTNLMGIDSNLGCLAIHSNGMDSRQGTLTRMPKQNGHMQNQQSSSLNGSLQVLPIKTPSDTPSSTSGMGSGSGSGNEFNSIPAHVPPPPIPSRENSHFQEQKYSNRNLLLPVHSAACSEFNKLSQLHVSTHSPHSTQTGLHTDSSDAACEELNTPSSGGKLRNAQQNPGHANHETHSGTDSTDSACITTPTNFTKRVSTQPTNGDHLRSIDSISPPLQFDSSESSNLQPPNLPPPPPPQSLTSSTTPTPPPHPPPPKAIEAHLKGANRGRISGRQTCSSQTPTGSGQGQDKSRDTESKRLMSRSSSIPSIYPPRDDSPFDGNTQQGKTCRRRTSHSVSDERLHDKSNSANRLSKDGSSRTVTPTASIAHSSTSGSSSSTSGSGPRKTSATQTTPQVKQVSFSPSTKATSSHRVVHRRHSRKHGHYYDHRYYEHDHYEYRHGHGHKHGKHSSAHGYGTLRTPPEYSRRRRRPAAHEYHYEVSVQDEEPKAPTGPMTLNQPTGVKDRKTKRRTLPVLYYSDPETCSTCSSTCSSCCSSSSDDEEDFDIRDGMPRTKSNQWQGGTRISYVPAASKCSTFGTASMASGSSIKSSTSDLNQVVTVSAKASSSTLRRKSRSSNGSNPEACSLM